jgi:transcriptional regulator with XRE-family HTH domain
MGALTIDAVEGRIRRLLGNKGMTNIQLARSIGMNPAALNSILGGISNPSLKTLIKIANVHGVTLDWLCGGEED